MSDNSNQGFMYGLSLAWMLGKRDLKNRYASSYGGLFWNIGVPLFNALIMAIIFSALMGGRMGLDYGDVPFVIFYFVPYSLWIVFAEVSTRATSMLKEHAYLINKIVFPYWVLPLVPFASALLSQIVILGIALILLYSFGIPLSPTSYIFVFIWLILIVLTIGVSYMISAISVYFTDMGQIVPICINVLFWLTPILYPSSMIGDRAPTWLQSVILKLNPFTYIAEFSRRAILGSGEIPILNLLILFGVSCILLLMGTYIFHKLKPGFADVL